MTIVTKPLTAVKEKKEDVEALVDVKTEAPVDHPNLNLDPIPLRDPRMELRSRHRHNLAFLSLCTGLISLMGFMAGIHLYKSIYQRRCREKFYKTIFFKCFSFLCTGCFAIHTESHLELSKKTL